MTTCPVCNKPVDPLRSRFVAVRDGKVVPYCSPECRDSQSSKPTKLPAADEARPKTPAVGIPTGAPRSIADLDSGPVIEIVHEPPRTKDDRITQPTGKFAKEELEIKDAKPRLDGSKASGGKDKAALAGEVVETAKRRPSGKQTRERRDSRESKAGWDWLDDEPAETARPGTVTESERKPRWPLVVLLVAAVGGGGAFAAYKYLGGETKPAVEGAGTASGAPAVVPEDAPSATKDAAVRAARKLLLDALATGTERVRGLAAAPLGRTGDPAAVAVLQQAVKLERVPSARFTSAYALARAGDPAGRDALVVGLASPDRSDKLDAAVHLARLGDPRARPLLQSLLGLAPHKLRAAEELARFKDPEALKLLEQIRTSDKNEDNQRTAMIALYRAGRTELADDVRELLDDKLASWRAPAMYALAEIAKDPSVKADLVEMVTHGVGVKVRAAVALRKLVGNDTDELVPALMTALSSEKDQEQFYAAEAILILVGEPQWAELE